MLGSPWVTKRNQKNFIQGVPHEFTENEIEYVVAVLLPRFRYEMDTCCCVLLPNDTHTTTFEKMSKREVGCIEFQSHYCTG
mmetsp:Transcript_34968/g.40450  ORF Transcript_34968/g.40450 Transcript_34968/m.40450 type:complete len:81 (+) Transcript_34968:397-639(+)